MCYFLLRLLDPQTGHKDHPTQPQEAPRCRKIPHSGPKMTPKWPPNGADWTSMATLATEHFAQRGAGGRGGSPLDSCEYEWLYVAVNM